MEDRNLVSETKSNFKQKKFMVPCVTFDGDFEIHCLLRVKDISQKDPDSTDKVDVVLMDKAGNKFTANSSQVDNDSMGRASEKVFGDLNLTNNVNERNTNKELNTMLNNVPKENAENRVLQLKISSNDLPEPHVDKLDVNANLSTTKMDESKKHFEKDKLFKCDNCGKNFTKKKFIRLHMSTHLKDRFKCDKCDKTYTNMNYLKRHSLIHSYKMILNNVKNVATRNQKYFLRKSSLKKQKQTRNQKYFLRKSSLKKQKQTFCCKMCKNV